MSNLRELYEKMLTGARLQGEVAKARAQFEFKPFAVEYRPLKVLATGGRWLLAVFSVVTGWACLYFVLVAGLPWWIAGPLAVALLSMIEALKNFLAGAAFRSWYGRGRVPVVALPALLVFSLSVFLSLQGVQQGYQVADNRAEVLQASHLSKVDSLQSIFDSQIAATKTELAAFKASVSWKGKINLYNKATASTLERYGAEIDRLQNEKAAALQQLRADHAGAVASLQADTGFNIRFWVCLSAGVETGIICCLWFLVYYSYRLASDSDILQTGERYEVTVQDVRHLLSNVAGGGGAAVPALASAPAGGGSGGQIGFRMGETKNEKNRGIDRGNTGINTPDNTGEQAKLRAYLAKYQHVVQALQEGASIGECCRKFEISKSTVQNVKRCLQAAQTTGQ